MYEVFIHKTCHTPKSHQLSQEWFCAAIKLIVAEVKVLYDKIHTAVLLTDGKQLSSLSLKNMHKKTRVFRNTQIGYKTFC